MNRNYFKRTLVTFACVALLLCGGKAMAQQLQYSRQNVFIQNPDDIQLVANVSGMHHLVSLSVDENVSIFIFNSNLEFEKKLATPIKIPTYAQVRIIAFADFYYIFIYSRQREKYSLWKVDAVGKCTDRTNALEQLLQPHLPHIESGFQLMENNDQLCVLYHTYIPKLEKNVCTMVFANSMLNETITKKVMYELKETAELLLEEKLISDKHLLVLKTTGGGTALKLMKVDVATGVVTSNEFFSSGYYFTQSSFNYNQEDAAITVSSLLVEPGNEYRRRHYVFVSRLNDSLQETIPFKLLKTQFRKNAGTNFMLANKQADWVRFKTSWGGSRAPVFDNGISISELYYPDEEQLQGVRFSLLDKNLKLVSDSLVKNNRDAYTVKPRQFFRFDFNHTGYLLVAHQFFTKRRGLLMIWPGNEHRLSYKYLPVVDRYDYLLQRAKVIPQKAVIIPYVDKLGAGLLKIKFD